jgi:putative Ca2+/H+ antiporter (TMEM165/GDT1 family)
VRALPAAVTPLLSAFGLVFIAELGDKSMLLAITMATRYRWWCVLVAIALETAVVMALAVLVGGAVDALLPDRVMGVGAGVLFLSFGAWTLLHREGSAEAVETTADRSIVLTIAVIAVAMFVSELGDKTQLATVSLAGTNPTARILVWIGATTGMVAADALAIFAGLQLHRVLPERQLALVAGVLFIVFGIGSIAITLW